MNPEGLRRSDEFIRHKILDAVGDLSLAGGLILGGAGFELFGFEPLKPHFRTYNPIIDGPRTGVYKRRLPERRAHHGRHYGGQGRR